MSLSKKSFLLLLALVITSLPVISQPGQGRKQQERMEALNSRRIAFMTDHLSLTPNEAKVFWPLYNQYIEKRDALMHGPQGPGQTVKPVKEMSATQAARYAEEEVKRLEESARIKREFHESLKEILNIEKIALLYESEKEFNRMLFREARRGEAGRGR